MFRPKFAFIEQGKNFLVVSNLEWDLLRAKKRQDS